MGRGIYQLRGKSQRTSIRSSREPNFHDRCSWNQSMCLTRAFIGWKPFEQHSSNALRKAAIWSRSHFRNDCSLSRLTDRFLCVYSRSLWRHRFKDSVYQSPPTGAGIPMPASTVSAARDCPACMAYRPIPRLTVVIHSPLIVGNRWLKPCQNAFLEGSKFEPSRETLKETPVGSHPPGFFISRWVCSLTMWIV